MPDEVCQLKISSMATPAIPWFRDLYEEILEYEGLSLYEHVLGPWIEKAQPAMVDMERFKSNRPLDRNDEAAPDAMWNLYALGRVNDLLLMSFQDNRENNSFPRLSLNEYEDFFSHLGFTIETSKAFSPFHHEIVQVHQSQEDDEPIGILQHLWPGLAFGEMQFSRSGVVVMGGRDHILQEIAEQSTLYFTFRRRNRKTNDLSMGWGSNSQWRTGFRRDYRIGNTLIYNADGTNVLKPTAQSREDRDGLKFEERVELCRNRCWIITSKDDSDLWPYDDRFEEQCE